MKPAWLMVGALLCSVGCRPAGPDPRKAEIEVSGDDQTLVFVQQSIDFWSKATNNDAQMSIVDRCDSGDLVNCIKLSVTTDLPSPNDLGWTGIHLGIDGMISGDTIIKIHPWALQTAPLEVISHEMGHALLLDHTEDIAQETAQPNNGSYDVELMRPVATSQIGCMGPATALEYRLAWGVSANIGTCLGQDGHQWYNETAHNPSISMAADQSAR